MKTLAIAILAVTLVAVSVNPSIAQQPKTSQKVTKVKDARCRKLEHEIYLLKHRRYACMGPGTACVGYWVK
jgi:hypothetical protein